jgi:DNA-directed RNA polymerase subunit RPC12/RpoP
MGKPFAAILKLSPEFRVEFDFGDNGKSRENGEAAAPVDFTGKEPVGKCPKCGARVFDAGMNYLCEHSASDKKCKFRAGKVILQQPIELAQFQKLLETGKTDLLNGFVSNRTHRKFEAFLVLKNGEVGFEFAPRKSKGDARAAKGKEAPANVDFTGQQPLGKCPKCGGKIFEGSENYLCERSQAETRKCAFKVGKVILSQPVDHATLTRLLTAQKSDLLTDFVSSKTGRPFKAYLVMDDKGKVTFDFPPREDEAAVEE